MKFWHLTPKKYRKTFVRVLIFRTPIRNILTASELSAPLLYIKALIPRFTTKIFEIFLIESDTHCFINRLWNKKYSVMPISFRSSFQPHKPTKFRTPVRGIRFLIICVSAFPPLLYPYTDAEIIFLHIGEKKFRPALHSDS